MRCEKSQYIFVYGTLMDGVDSAMARLLQQGSEALGDGWIPGRLYDLGQYPGAVYDAQASTRVYGRIFRPHDATTLLECLDNYEGIDSENPAAAEYMRALTPVQGIHGTLWCWVYLYQLSIEGLPEIPGGNYLDYLKSNVAHLHFIKTGR